MTMNSLLAKGAVGLAFLSALPGGVGVLYASGMISGRELTLEEKIAKNREKLKKIIDDLEKRFGEKFKWNEDRWNTVVEKMKKLVPEHLRLKLVDYLWSPYVISYQGPSGYYYVPFFYHLMNGSWRIGDSNFQRWLKHSSVGNPRLYPEYGEGSNVRFRELPLPEVYFSDEVYLKVKEWFNFYRKGYLEKGVDVPEWNDSVWDLLILDNSFKLKDSFAGLMTFDYVELLVRIFVFSSAGFYSVSDFRIDCFEKGLSSKCVEILKREYRGLSSIEFFELGLERGQSKSVFSEEWHKELCKLDFKIEKERIASWDCFSEKKK